MATAYGVWQNGDSSSTKYTIVGGYQPGPGLNKGFLLDYDSSTGDITNLTPFDAFEHFEGITVFEGGYALAATTDTGAAYAIVGRNADGSFGKASWVAIANPNSIGISTANTVIDNNLLGVYHPADGLLQSYVAAVPEPSALSLLGIGMAGFALLHAGNRRNRRHAA